ncbi:mitochondrial ribosomal protein L2 [Lycorma delicatula]|uniref:mitochondrial ribosomal protein L2 n=1 Tax=Lycorma delicatula TaxID=130591 RepID=UPI003F51371D
MAFLLRSLSVKTALTSSFIICDSLKLNGPCLSIVKFYKLKQILPPKSGKFVRKVHYPEEYTVKPLDVTRLGGRDPETGRKVVNRVGGGLKYKYHWIDFKRVGPKEDGPPLEEQVMLIEDAFERTAKIALVASGDRMKWIIASENMKPGDIIRTSQFIPVNPICANEGDAYPLGALQIGTLVHSIEKFPGTGGFYCHSAGTCAKISKCIGDKVVIVLPSKDEIALPRESMAVVGRVSNPDHFNIPIGSAQRSRELGIRPKSGLWHKKDGRFGRKIHPPKPIKFVTSLKEEKPEELQLTLYMKRKSFLQI